MTKHHDITVGDRTIGPDHEPFVIAEMSGNHNGDLERALDIVRAAGEVPAHRLASDQAELRAIAARAAALFDGFAGLMVPTAPRHPTLAEGVMEAARAADGWLIHG